MRKTDLIWFFVVELFAIVWAGAMFKTLSSPFIAGLWAGAYFVFSGIWMLRRSSQWPGRWWSLTWYVLWIHVAVVSIPMLVVRLYERHLAFSEVTIWGLPGPVFHQLSTGVFSVLLMSTLVDLGRSLWTATSRGPDNNKEESVKN